MNMPSRRRALQVLAAGALVPIMYRGAPLMAASGHFAPNIGIPMVFTRTIERSLSDGAAIIVRRSFLIRFQDVGTGFAVTGEQSDIVVSAPSALSSLAAIERSRVDTSSFPLQLGVNGWIMGAGDAPDQAALNEAVAKATALIRAANLPEDEAAQARVFLVNIQKAASDVSSQPPADLFCPPTTKRIDKQSVTLPDGAEGQIEVSFEGKKSPESGLMQSAERSITTTLASSSRHSSERWNLSPQD